MGQPRGRVPVWITGVGTATPLGTRYTDFADRLLAGQSCIRVVQRFNVAEHPSQIAGDICSIPCPPELADPALLTPFGNGSPIAFERLHRLEQLVLWCCVQALQDSGWWQHRAEQRIGMVLGMGAEWLLLWESGPKEGGRDYNNPKPDTDSLLERARQTLGLSGPITCVSAACASGNYALAQARSWLELGWADLCLAGGCDMGVSPMSLAGFGNLRALSRRNDQPQLASRPFDCDRDGFVMGEGGAVFVLEPAPLAQERKARAYAQVAGCGSSSDAYHMVIPSPDPEPAVAAMRQALTDAQVNPDQIDYINAHATSTPVGDICETKVLQEVLGPALRQTPISSTKSMTGHLLTGAAAVEALACLAAMERGALPPTINLDHPDPECNLCHVANQAWDRPVKVAVSNSFGFGGSNTCLVLRAV
jgi:3-oxoacyl-[acyl-carrier-protein] synthase II